MKKLRDENANVPPPNPFSNLIQTYGKECTSSGRETKRVRPDIANFNIRHGVQTNAINRVKFERMHYLEWIHFKTQIKRFPFAQAKGQWDSSLERATDKEKRYDGPMGDDGKTACRYPCHCLTP